MARIPFNRPFVTGNETTYIQQAIANCHTSGDGPFSKKCHELLQDDLGVREALLTTSCTDALEMSALLLNVGPGDEVIIPSYTFVSTANAFVLHGARPVFVDIRPDTLNMDERQLKGLITEKTKAIVVVHYAGVGCEMDEILSIAADHNLPVVEDNAHGLYAKYRNRWLGALGNVACQSFHETKNLTCGEGGAILINDESLLERAEILREKGTNRKRFIRGEVDKYTWVDVGSSFLPSDILAAFLYAQLEQRVAIQARRGEIWDYYFKELSPIFDPNSHVLPFVPDYCEHSNHMFYLLTANAKERTAFIKFMGKRGIQCVFHYVPLHLSDMGKHFGCKKGDCPVTEDVSERIVRLPFFNDLTDEQMAEVVAGVKAFYSA